MDQAKKCYLSLLLTLHWPELSYWFYLMAVKRIKKSSVLEDEDNKDTGDHFQSLTQEAEVTYHSMFQYRIKKTETWEFFKFSSLVK